MSTLTWKQIKGTGSGIEGHTMVQITKERLFVFGGNWPYTGYSNRTLTLDLYNSTWIERRSLANPSGKGLAYHRSVLVHEQNESYVLSFGGLVEENKLSDHFIKFDMK